MKVYRVEHSENKKGPYSGYRADGSANWDWMEDRSKHCNDPNHDGWHSSNCRINERIQIRFDSIMPREPGYKYSIALNEYSLSFVTCLTCEEDISFWFSDTELVTLFNLGFRIYTYEIDESYVVHGDNRQSAFIREKATNRKVWL